MATEILRASNTVHDNQVLNLHLQFPWHFLTLCSVSALHFNLLRADHNVLPPKSHCQKQKKKNACFHEQDGTESFIFLMSNENHKSLSAFAL